MNRMPVTKRSKHKGNSGLLGGDQRVTRTARFFIWVLALSIISVLVVSTVAVGQITVSGTQAQRNKIASWLTKSLGTTVTVAADGTLSVAAGGNASATRLRNMANDPNVSVTLDVVDKDPNVFFGAWNSEDPNNPTGKTTGTQTIDVNDLEHIGNVLNPYGFTPDWVLMHEVAEVYEGQKHHGDCWDYWNAHPSGGIVAENELMGEHGTSTVARFTPDPNGKYLLKIKRPDGSHVVVVFDPSATDPNKLVQWCRERVDCNTASGLIAIADPDPQVHILSYDFDGNHTISGTWDTVDSHPTGVAFAPSGNLYVTENLAGADEIRIFDACGVHVGVIVGSELIDPEGIDVDQQTGDVFVAVEGGVLRYDSNSDLVGSYSTPDPNFAPTDVAVWRNDGLRVQCMYAQSQVYALFVTDRASNQVYHFDVEDDMGGSSYSLAFGGEYLDCPEGLTVGAYGAVWVASTGNDRIYRFSRSGNLISQDGSDYFVEDASRNFFDLVMVDGDGIYVVDETPQQGAILLYDLEAELVATLGEGEVQCPRAIAAQFRVNWDNLLPLDLAVYASNPRPLDSETDVERDPVLSWSPGKYAGSHDVYLGTDWQDVNDADTETSSVYKGSHSLDFNSYYPVPLQLDTTCYWRIDEVNGPNTWKGGVWTFTTANYLVVDDMESYDNDNRIYYTWEDFAWNDTGAEVALGVGPSDPVHGGSQSMIYWYDNDLPWALYEYSEISAETGGGINQLQIGPDWTEAGVKALTLYFYGDADNDADDTEQMYVGLEDSRGAGSYAEVRYGDQGEDMNDIKIEEWQEWNIALSDFTGVYANNVEKVYIGFGDRFNPIPGGNGTVYFDDIRLYLPRCFPEYVHPADITGNCFVDWSDLIYFTQNWLCEPQGIPDECDALDIYPAGGDGTVDSRDYSVLADVWLHQQPLWPP